MMATMTPKMQTAHSELARGLAQHDTTRGLYVRVHGDHLIVGRTETVNGVDEPTDRVRLTRLNSRTYGLSVKRHTGRWQRIPFSGTIPEMVETIATFMQHLVAAY
jgi:hypothetical protein